MSLYLAKTKWEGSKFPTPNDLMNLDLFTECKQLDCSLSVVELNRHFKDEPFRINDIRMIRDKGFTVIWHNTGVFWLLFDIENEALTDFKRDFKLRQILTI